MTTLAISLLAEPAIITMSRINRKEARYEMAMRKGVLFSLSGEIANHLAVDS
ncbi:MAG: hypothetical protein ACLFN7_00470 [Candidatus Acetothermia bacterium]